MATLEELDERESIDNALQNQEFQRVWQRIDQIEVQLEKLATTIVLPRSHNWASTTLWASILGIVIAVLSGLTTVMPAELSASIAVGISVLYAVLHTLNKLNQKT